MQITIHRATQIGGQITRISTAQASIIIDLGHNLPNHAEDKDVYDDDCAIAKITEGCLLYSTRIIMAITLDYSIMCRIIFRNILARLPNKWFAGNISNYVSCGNHPCNKNIVAL